MAGQLQKRPKSSGTSKHAAAKKAIKTNRKLKASNKFKNADIRAELDSQRQSLYTITSTPERSMDPLRSPDVSVHSLVDSLRGL